MAKHKKNPAHYVDNKEFHAALCEWKKGIVEADESGEARPPITEYIGSCFLKIAQGLSRRACFINYQYREEMVGDAVENAILYAHNFKPEGKNPFAYFTQIIWFAFLRRIQKEKKQTYIKFKASQNMLTQSILADTGEGPTITMNEPPEYISRFIDDFEKKFKKQPPSETKPEEK